MQWSLEQDAGYFYGCVVVLTTDVVLAWVLRIGFAGLGQWFVARAKKAVASAGLFKSNFNSVGSPEANFLPLASISKRPFWIVTTGCWFSAPELYEKRRPPSDPATHGLLLLMGRRHRA